jgi:predicted metal-dependent hydrolase
MAADRPRRVKPAGQLDRDVTEHQRMERLSARIRQLIKKWEPILGVHVKEAHHQPLKTYWASANEATRKITFNSKLADMSPAYVEVTVVHEMVHFLTNGHDKRFYELMDRHVPGWRRLHAKYAEPLTRDS